MKKQREGLQLGHRSGLESRPAFRRLLLPRVEAVSCGDDLLLQRFGGDLTRGEQGRAALFSGVKSHVEREGRPAARR